MKTLSLFHRPMARLQRHDLWISELLTRVLISLYAGTLAVMLVLIGVNQVRIQRLDAKVRMTKASSRIIAAEEDSLRARDKIVRGIRFLRGRPLPQRTATLLADLVYDNSRRFGYDPLMLLAVIHVESRFEKSALGRKRSGELSGALGLMQLKFETAQEMAQRIRMELKSPNDLFNPEINIPLGIYYLTKMVMAFESFPLGILAYNQGPETIRKSVRGELPLSSQYYVKVMRSYYELKRRTDE